MKQYDPEKFRRVRPGGERAKPIKRNPPRTPIRDERGLDLQRQVLVKEYSDPTSKGYMNATEAMKIANPHLAHDSAREKGPRLIAEPEVRSAIEDEFDKMGFGVARRMRILKGIAENPQAETTQYDEEGNVSQRTVYEDRKSQLRALDLSFKLDGSYDKAQAIGAVARRQITRAYAEYEKQMMRSIRTLTPQSDQSTDHLPEDELPQSEEQTPPSSPESDPWEPGDPSEG